MRDTNVVTSFTTGTTINMSANDAIFFLENLAMTTIAQCRHITFNKDEFDRLETTINLPEYDALIDEYCDGVHGAVLWNMIMQNVKILQSFVADCVLNRTVAGLYLMIRPNAVNRGIDKNRQTYELILKALDEATDMMRRQHEFLDEKGSYIKFNEKNDEFRKLMEG